MLSSVSYVAAEQLADRRAAAVAFRAARDAAAATAAAPGERVVLRRAGSQDSAALVRLAQLDGAPRPSSPMLVAERDDTIVAAVPFDGGRAIADPFLPTAELIELLRARVQLLAAAAPSGRGQHRRLRRRQVRMRTAA